MPPRKPYAKKATHPRRKPVHKARAARSKFGKAGTTSVSKDNYACSVEVYQTVVDIHPNQAYAIAPTLSQFLRSSEIATNYQHYRCVSVNTKFEPLFNNFVASGSPPSAPTVPQLFYQMNRSGTQPSVLNLKWFEDNGSKPMKLTADKVIKYKPNTSIMGASPNNGSGVGGDTVAWDKWVNTYQDVSGSTSTEILNDTVPFYGHLFWIDQLDVVPASPTQPVARMVITTKWEFNKPYAQPPTIGVDGATSTIRL